MKHRFIRGIGCLAAGLFLLAGAAEASPELLSITLNTSRYMSLPNPITRIAVGNPEIATVVQVPSSDKEFLIVSHKAGTTSLFIWTSMGERFEYTIGVSPEDTAQAQLIQQAIGLPFVHVRMVDGKVLLSGMVKNQYERNYAVQTAQLYVNGSKSNITTGSGTGLQFEAQSSRSGTASNVGGNETEAAGNVIDLLHMMKPTQIRLEAQVIAINPEDTRQLGLLYSSADGSGLLSDSGLFFGGSTYKSYNGSGEPHFVTSAGINGAIRALVVQSRAKVLSRPSIVTMSGEEAAIQVGGKIPYVVRDSNGNPSTRFEDYGIILQFKPTADAEDRIVTSVHTEVSKPNGETVDGQPVLDVRRADSVVTVAPGSTMVIGGLMDSSENKNFSKIPLLGDIPILGEFFKFSSKSKEKQELIILVTPYLITEDNFSHARMSKDMQEFYEKGRKEEKEREDVDVNKPLPEERKNDPDEGTILKKQLNREVLPIPKK